MADVPIGNEGSLTGATAVTILAAPAAATQRVVPSDGASVYNADSANRDFTFQKNKGGTITILHKVVGVVPGGRSGLPKKVVLDATNESLEARSDAVAATVEPHFDVAAMETT